jgi:dihydrofolate reductase
MRKLKYHVAVTLDGCIAAPDGTWDKFVKEGPPVDDFLRSLENYDTVLMGRNTYEVGVKMGITNPYPTMKQYVFSRTMTVSPDPNVQLVRENANEVIRELKAGDDNGKDIWLCGAGDFASSLFDAELIDELIVKLNPRLFGVGIRVVNGLERPLALELFDSKIYNDSMLLLHYRVNYGERL